MTSDDWAELEAIHKNVRDIGCPTFQHRLNWPRLKQMQDAGIVELGPHPEFGKDYLAVSLTQAGMFNLWKRNSSAKKSED
jgi:hypothetical protein